ncbi:MAG: enoyl-CoA hydratase/isomerase family protein [Chloroflexi bacterium]|nr:enoyl-CoA hydratase/isomerase family protein [Chloroflexota bacterium]
MSTVLYEINDKIARVTLNRPEKLNSINQEMRDELWAVWQDVKNNPDVWVVILTGNGRAFCTGHDLKEFGIEQEMRGVGADDLYLFQLTIYKPIIAAINGVCLAQGGGLALCSDIRIASDQAQFGWPQARRGISSVSGPCLLAHLAPTNRALEFLMTGRMVSPQEAERFSLVNEVVAHEELMPRVEALAQEIRSNAPLAVRAIKEVTMRGLGMQMEDRVRFASLMLRRIEQTADAKEGLTAFAEKRQPTWSGR